MPFSYDFFNYASNFEKFKEHIALCLFRLAQICSLAGVYHKAQPGGFYGFYEGGFWGFYGFYVFFIDLKVFLLSNQSSLQQPAAI